MIDDDYNRDGLLTLLLRISQLTVRLRATQLRAKKPYSKRWTQTTTVFCCDDRFGFTNLNLRVAVRGPKDSRCWGSTNQHWGNEAANANRQAPRILRVLCQRGRHSQLSHLFIRKSCPRPQTRDKLAWNIENTAESDLDYAARLLNAST